MDCLWQGDKMRIPLISVKDSKSLALTILFAAIFYFSHYKRTSVLFNFELHTFPFRLYIKLSHSHPWVPRGIAWSLARLDMGDGCHIGFLPPRCPCNGEVPGQVLLAIQSGMSNITSGRSPL